MGKSYDDFTPEDWVAQAKADEFDAQIKANGGPSPEELEKQAEEGNNR